LAENVGYPTGYHGSSSDILCFSDGAVVSPIALRVERATDEIDYHAGCLPHYPAVVVEDEKPLTSGYRFG
jgi:hypothetical protein